MAILIPVRCFIKCVMFYECGFPQAVGKKHDEKHRNRAVIRKTNRSHPEHVTFNTCKCLETRFPTIRPLLRFQVTKTEIEIRSQLDGTNTTYDSDASAFEALHF